MDGLTRADRLKVNVQKLSLKSMLSRIERAAACEADSSLPGRVSTEASGPPFGNAMDNTPALDQKWGWIIPKALSTLRDLGVIQAFFHITELYLSFHLLDISHIYPFSLLALQPLGLKSPTTPLHEFHTQGQLYPSCCSCLLLHSECLFFLPISSNSPPRESLFLHSQAVYYLHWRTGNTLYTLPLCTYHPILQFCVYTFGSLLRW